MTTPGTTDTSPFETNPAGATATGGNSTDNGNDPGAIARSLVRELGHANAYLEAAREGYLAQTEGRYYELSVWREVKAILRAMR